MSRLDEIKARAEQVHWTSTSIEQAMARMASSAADVPWLASEVDRLTAERDALQVGRDRDRAKGATAVLNEELRTSEQEARARRAEAEVERLTDLCDEFRKREESQDRIRERLTAEVERLERWKAEATEVMSGLRELGKALGLGLGVQITGPAALVEVERLTAERDALAAQVARVEEVLDHWRTVDEGNAAYAERIGERSRFADGLASRADMLRAALAGSEANTSDTQPTDPGCGCSTNPARARYADGDPAGCYCTCSDDAREGCEHEPDEPQPTGLEVK